MGGEPVEPHLAGPIFGGPHIVGVIVDETGNDCSTLKVDHLRCKAFELFKISIAANCNNTLALDGQRLRNMKLIINSDNFSIREHQVSRLSKACGGPDHCKGDNDRVNYYRGSHSSPLRIQSGTRS